MTIETKFLRVPFELKEFQDNENYFKFSGYASTFNNVDRGDDVVLKGAFINTISRLMKKNKKGKLPLLWQHDKQMPIGIFTNLVEDKEGLYVEGEMPKSDTFVSGRVVPQMNIGSIDSMSIGYGTIDYDLEKEKRILKQLELFEISLVTTPMNERAVITDMKCKGATTFKDYPLGDRQRSWDVSKAITRIKKWAGVEDSPNEKYKEAFLWYDSDKADNFTAYKMPIIDIIDGKATVIPRAVFAAAGALRGARGGVNIPDNDKNKVISHVEKYYKKLNLESPFSKSLGFRIDDLSIFQVRDVEHLLHTGMYVSNKLAKTISSNLKSLLRDEGDNDSNNNWNLVIKNLNEFTKQYSK